MGFSEKEGVNTSRELKASSTNIPKLKMLDLQWVSFIQRLWFMGDETGSPDVDKNHFAVARLQINANIREERWLPDRIMLREMMRLEFYDVLRILENAERNADEVN